METLGYILGAITIVWIWDQHLWPSILKKQDTLGYKYRFGWLEKLDRKPLSCATCLSFYLGIALFYWLGDIYFISLPLAYKLITKHLL